MYSKNNIKILEFHNKKIEELEKKIEKLEKMYYPLKEDLEPSLNYTKCYLYTYGACSCDSCIPEEHITFDK
tara:strand:- start:356 stop:568 length:213 start_codon:yes stop_codon:yes gene_type:complete